ncbi:hypothetical protein F8M49_22255 [Rhodococcus zopfii]|uniref:Uncharacterized protein n=1 Tax=Rhodococcus zopfii TaxID=43772 RepID=A0ABU3WTV4_9NOCA|nr:hypothetical protein [Rhodococcus zopfii]
MAIIEFVDWSEAVFIVENASIRPVEPITPAAADGRQARGGAARDADQTTERTDQRGDTGEQSGELHRTHAGQAPVGVVGAGPQ